MAPPQESKRAADLRTDGNNGQNVAASPTGRDPSLKTGPGFSKPPGSKSRDDQYYPTAYIVLPGDSKMPLAMSGGAFELSSQIRASCVDYIECEREDTAIRVTGKSPAHVQAAVRDINDAIRGLRTKEATGHTHLLVQPPDTPVYNDGVVILHSDGGSKQGTRPRLRTGGRGMAAPNPRLTPSLHEEKIVDLFRDAMSRLQAMSCNLKMRANFGFVKLHPQRSDPSEYDLNHFAAISDTLRGRAAPTFDASFGPGVSGNRMLEHIISTFSSSAVKGASAGLDRDMYHTVSLSSSDRYVEATITHATDKHGDSRQRLTNVEMFRRHNWNTLDLYSASPHLKHDWHLEVAMRDPVRPSPPWLDNLKQRVFLSAPPANDVLSHNPRLKIEAIPELSNRIDTTTLETSVRVRYPKTPYEINVSVTRKWMGTNTGVRSDPVCTISMGGVSWDERMTSVGSWKQGSWEPELGGVFSESEQGFRVGFVNFIQCVKRLQVVLGEVHPGEAISGMPREERPP